MAGINFAQFGQWNAEIETRHSNYKELLNLVIVVENAEREGILEDCELFLFTDNFTAECAY